jgi:signal transduction histidine kinase
MRIVIGFGAAFTVLALVLPFPLVTMVVVPYQIFTVLISLYVLYVLINAVRYSRDGAVLALIGCGVLALSVLVDILYYNNVTSNGNVVPVGIIVSIFTTALIISIRMAKTYREAEVLSRRMQEMNAGLERKVRERTLDLEESNQHLERVNGDLARLEKSRRQLLSNISHDLGTPITLIQGYVEALLDGIVERPEQQQKYLRLIHSRVTGLSRLIQDLFQLSKLEARQISFSIQEITVEEYVRHFYERYELEVKNAGLTFDFQVTSPPGGMGGYVQVDLDRMDQVYTNVIYNAVKYTPAGGKIRLVYSVEESLIVTKIIDTGCGIEQEDLPYIFDRFYMKDKSRNSAAGGSGLGLSIAKEIVEFHGGNIWAESRVHQGTSICFLLPVSYRSLVS